MRHGAARCEATHRQTEDTADGTRVQKDGVGSALSEQSLPGDRCRYTGVGSIFMFHCIVPNVSTILDLVLYVSTGFLETAWQVCHNSAFVRLRILD